MSRLSFFQRFALPILCVIFFLVPFSFRGARLSLQRMQNNVADWLPQEFEETATLRWFGEHFVGEESFILLTWEGCTAEDESFRLLVKKLEAEVARPAGISNRASVGDQSEASSWGEAQQQNAEHRAALEDVRARDLGDKLGLFSPASHYQDWGGSNEKWLQGNHGQWYYVLPNGELYRWLGDDNLLASLRRLVERRLRGKSLDGEFIATFGERPSAQRANDFHNDPHKLTARVLRSVTTGPAELQRLEQELRPIGNYSEQERARIARADALERLTGTLYGPDGEQTCIVVVPSDSGSADLRRLIGRGLMGQPRGKLIDLAAAAGVPVAAPPRLSPFAADVELPDGVLRLGGPPVDNVAIDEEGQITLVRLVGLSLVLGLALSWISFRSVKITIMVFLVGGLSAITSLGIVFWSGAAVDAVLMSMPSLVYVLGLSGAIHIVNYYREAARSDGVKGAADRAVAHGWWPCTLAALTTAIGLLSLYQSNIFPIRKFGLYSAIGVLATLGLLFTYLPAALQLWPPADNRRHTSVASSLFERIVLGFWSMLGRFVIRRHVLVMCVCFAAMCCLAIGINRITPSVQLMKLFDPKSKIISDYQWLEKNFGKLVPMEMVVKVRPEMMQPTAEQLAGSDEQETLRDQVPYQMNSLERLELVSMIQQSVEREFGDQGCGVVGRGMSVATLVPKIPAPGAPARRVFNRRLERNRERILAENYLAIDQHSGEELWRVNVRLGALSGVDYGEFVSELERAVTPITAACDKRQQILRAIQVARGTNNYRTSRVLLLGKPDASPPGPLPVAAQHGSQPVAVQPAARVTSERHQELLFADALSHLMQVKGFREGGRKQSMTWLAAGELPGGDGPGAPERVDLSAFDCVVLLQDHPDYSLPQIAEASQAFVDARIAAWDQAADAARAKPVDVAYTGVVPIVYKAQRTLLTSLIDSIGWAFVLIVGVMMVLLRDWSRPLRPTNLLNVSGGLASMLPNIFPVVIIFGLMGHLGWLVDIGSMMTASVAMGVAVDDTIHFLAWFRRGLRQGLDRNQSIMMAYRRCAIAMTQTTLIGGLGLSVFALSTFTPTQRFGVMMLGLLGAALVGDLIMLPAMLASPLGRCFGKTRSPSLSPHEKTDDRGTRYDASHHAPPEPASRASSVLSVDRAST